MARTLTLEIPDPVYKALAELAERRGEAAGQTALSAIEQLASDPREKYIGAFASGAPGWVHSIDQHVAAEAADDHEPDA